MNFGSGHSSGRHFPSADVSVTTLG